ncbi:squalene epoxidase-domain-containing protein [Pseudomassariella vexata]|uniref:Squalene monooxygenase n=1 Tax=Pseudomassariella vexata TaxID=1141098 RepID=A0A1Y2E1W0_9PEZI|nr:squalene epoxidase-domain-containing protein [Pseudomassariella vexata]ORY65489.1 squalene epoxidase-domain-containing protein [Pseudomassariella vexata]
MTTETITQDERAQRRQMYHEADVVVVGAGVFGCAIAFALANQDRSVLLLERWMKEPDRIVGELMQPGGVQALKQLGLGHTIEDIDAIPCTGYDVIFHGNHVVIPYPEIRSVNGRASVSAKGDEKAGGPAGCSFHHGRFITKLRETCLKHPNITVVETEAIKTIKGEHNPEILGVEARTVDQSTGEKKPDFFFGQLTIIADGYASKFRKQYIDRAPIVKSKFYALELIDCPLPHPGFGHVVIGDGSPVLLYQIGTHETRALIDVPENCPAAAPSLGGVRNYISNVVLPSLPPVIQPSFREALEKDNKIPRSMPNSWLPPTRQCYPGLVLLGDAMNMRHPLTGGGMTVALNDVVILTDLLAPERIPNFGDTGAIASAMSTFHWRRKRLTSIINVLAMALYSLFSAADPNLGKLQRGCFAYFEKGITADPMALMGGLIHNPLNLAYHFFAVAFLAIWVDMKNTGLWNVPVNLWNAISVLWTASMVFLPVMWRELM